MNFGILYICAVLIKNADIKIFRMCMCVPEYVYVYHVCTWAHRGQSWWGEDVRSLELELQKTLGVHMGAGHWIRVFWTIQTPDT